MYRSKQAVARHPDKPDEGPANLRVVN
jgi:hypothetical protein